MLTRYVLHIDGREYVLGNGDLQNWDDIKCSLKRDGYDGIVRSFSSQFEFTGTAYSLVMALYLRDGFKSNAQISVATCGNDWMYTEQFRCALDFTTIEWTDTVLSINALDKTASAIISSGKSTTYEMVVGQDIFPDKTFHFDRIPMKETLLFEFTQGESYDDSADITVSTSDGRIWVGNISSDVGIGGAIYWKDDQTKESNSYLIEALKDLSIRLTYDFGWRTDQGSGAFRILASVYRNNSRVKTITLAHPAQSQLANIGTFDSYAQLQASYPDYSINLRNGWWANVNGEVWLTSPAGNNTYIWIRTSQPADSYFSDEAAGIVDIDLQQGDRIVIEAPSDNNRTSDSMRFIRSQMTFEWMTSGEEVDIPAITPEEVCNAILRKMGEGVSNISCDISIYDGRIRNTVMLAAESIRGLDGAKFYSSFSDFADWMSIVFGYIYSIEESTSSEYVDIRQAHLVQHTPGDVINSYDGEVDMDNIIYYVPLKRFAYLDGEDVCLAWPGDDYYQDERGIRRDMVFRLLDVEEFGDERLVTYNGRTMVPYLFRAEDIHLPFQVIRFTHRCELYEERGGVDMEHLTDLKYSVDNDSVYSSVTIGYSTKTYDSINGRDEFNFSNTYSTGLTSATKDLKLECKFRADSYGIEFTAQKRGETTTDSGSDKDVFFVLVTEDEYERLVPDRTDALEGTLTDKVFNAAFSPLACIEANKGYIAMQDNPLKLKFASCTGNSDVKINGVGMSDDIVLDGGMLTSGEIEFTTSDVNFPADVNAPIIAHHKGVRYIGFLKEADFGYAKTEAVDYKLVLKRMEV